MADLTDIQDAIAENATGPKSVTNGETSVTEHSIDDQIKAAKFTANQTGVTNPSRGLRFTKLIPPGAI